MWLYSPKSVPKNVVLSIELTTDIPCLMVLNRGIDWAVMCLYSVILKWFFLTSGWLAVSFYWCLLHECLSIITLSLWWYFSHYHYSEVTWAFSNHWLFNCLYNCLLRLSAKKTSGLCMLAVGVGNLPVTNGFPAQMASSVESLYMPWHHNTFMSHYNINFLIIHIKHFIDSTFVQYTI